MLNPALRKQAYWEGYQLALAKLAQAGPLGAPTPQSYQVPAITPSPPLGASAAPMEPAMGGGEAPAPAMGISAAVEGAGQAAAQQSMGAPAFPNQNTFNNVLGGMGGGNQDLAQALQAMLQRPQGGGLR
jgi:hypothetical protein